MQPPARQPSAAQVANDALRHDPHRTGTVPTNNLDADQSADAATFNSEEAIDDALEMTFPASDPPAWMSSGHAPG